MAAGLAQPGVRDYPRQSTPQARVATPEDTAAVVAFLISDDSSHMAETVVVDGGGGFA